MQLPESPKHTISATEPDWSREQRAGFWSWQPSRALLAAIRCWQRHEARPWGLLSSVISKVAVFRYRFWTVITGTDIPINANLGGGLLIPHPNGVVIHPAASIGPNCLLFQQVTIGATAHGVPVLGGHVDVGAGAKIIGPIRIGNHVRIGANAVVTQDVPDGATAVGIPARVVAHKASPDDDAFVFPER